MDFGGGATILAYCQELTFLTPHHGARRKPNGHIHDGWMDGFFGLCQKSGIWIFPPLPKIWTWISPPWAKKVGYSSHHVWRRPPPMKVWMGFALLLAAGAPRRAKEKVSRRKLRRRIGEHTVLTIVSTVQYLEYLAGMSSLQYCTWRTVL